MAQSQELALFDAASNISRRHSVAQQRGNPVHSEVIHGDTVCTGFGHAREISPQGRGARRTYDSGVVHLYRYRRTTPGVQLSAHGQAREIKPPRRPQAGSPARRP
ncbi:Uncharacterised protein [Mycobacteroides abscessus subsp. abscessus]|nr:Uncharacterised protein [Mycobacteroides abscessus subsp. abscessus]